MNFSAVYPSMAYLNLMLNIKADFILEYNGMRFVYIFFASLTCVPIIRNEEDSTKYSKDDYIKSSSNFIHIL